MKRIYAALILLAASFGPLSAAAQCVQESDTSVIYKKGALLLSYSLTDTGDKILFFEMSEGETVQKIVYLLQRDLEKTGDAQTPEATAERVLLVVDGDQVKLYPTDHTSDDEKIFMQYLTMPETNRLRRSLKDKDEDALRNCLQNAKQKEFKTIDKESLCGDAKGHLVPFGMGRDKELNKEQILCGPQQTVGFAADQKGIPYYACVDSQNQLINLAARFKPGKKEQAVAKKLPAWEEAQWDFITMLSKLPDDKFSTVTYQEVSGTLLKVTYDSETMQFNTDEQLKTLRALLQSRKAKRTN